MYTQVYACTQQLVKMQVSFRKIKMQVSFRKRAMNYRALLRKMTQRDKAFSAFSPPCNRLLQWDKESSDVSKWRIYNTCICIYICTRLSTESICSGTQSHHMSERNEYKKIQYMCTRTHFYTYIHTSTCMRVYVCTCVCVNTIGGVIRFSAVTKGHQMWANDAYTCIQYIYIHMYTKYAVFSIFV